MDEDQKKEVIASLVDFVTRVSKGGARASQIEIQVLPGIVCELLAASATL
jgi:hypothetical protein